MLIRTELPATSGVPTAAAYSQSYYSLNWRSLVKYRVAGLLYGSAAR